MAEHPPESTRPRTATRLRYVAPPGMGLDRPQGEVNTIGRYEILEVLGKGAMGVVYKARDPMLDRIVAVKTIVSPRGSGRRVKRAYLERFQREAKAAAKMSHPAIVTIFDVGLEGGAPFMVLEYLPGESLADRLDRVRMPLGKAVQIALDLASSLSFAHKQRIVHRDVKPANVLHAGEERWKLADFGIARMPDSDLTQVGIFMGTPGYAPPEAISQGRYTSQADVFAWGAVLYELLSGRIPYEGPDTRTTNGYVLKTTAKSPRHWDASIPEPLAEVTMRALHPSTEKRYKTGSEAEDALRKAWDRCLNQSLVSPAALVSKEIPHEEAPKLFHSTRAAEESRAGAAAPERPIVIEPSEPVVSDDDPTRIYNQKEIDAVQASKQERLFDVEQDEKEPKQAPTPRSTEDDIITRAREVAARAEGDLPEIEARARAAAGRKPDTPPVELLGADPPRLGLWILVVLAVLIAGAIGGYYLANM